MLSYTRERELILTIGQRMFAKDMVASNDGNISIRLPDDKYLITPTGVSKGFMRAEELCVIDGNGAVVEGSSRPSSEYKMHLEVYRRRRDVNACVHAHPRVATAFAVSRTELNKLSLPEVVFSVGSIRLADYASPSSAELPLRVAEKIMGCDALLLANHGALTVDATPMGAYYKMETLEHFASISLYARLLGGEYVLPESEREKLLRIRREVYQKKQNVLDGPTTEELRKEIQEIVSRKLAELGIYG